MSIYQREITLSQSVYKNDSLCILNSAAKLSAQTCNTLPCIQQTIAFNMLAYGGKERFFGQLTAQLHGLESIFCLLYFHINIKCTYVGLCSRMAEIVIGSEAFEN